MSQRRSSDHSPVEILTHNGRKFRRISSSSTAMTSSVAAGGTTNGINRPLTENSTTSLMMSSTSHKLSHNSPTHNMSPRASLTRSFILPPPQQPAMTAKGRPFSAKRTIRTRPKSIFTLQPTDEYRLQFALHHSKPLPPIGNLSSSISPTAAHRNRDSLGEVDSAVDLEYYSQCCTPTDQPSSSIDGSVTMSTYLQEKVRETVKSEQDLSNTLRSASLSDDSVITPSDYSNKSHVPRRNVAVPVDNKNITLCLKLPVGDRLQVDFPLSTTLKEIVEYAETFSGSSLKECEISTNEIPKRVFTDWSLSLYNAGILVRTVLHFSSL